MLGRGVRVGVVEGRESCELWRKWRIHGFRERKTEDEEGRWWDFGFFFFLFREYCFSRFLSLISTKLNYCGKEEIKKGWRLERDANDGRWGERLEWESDWNLTVESVLWCCFTTRIDAVALFVISKLSFVFLWTLFFSATIEPC